MRIDVDVSSLLAGAAHKDDIAQALAEHPAELMAEVAEEQEDVERSLMVGHKHIHGLGVDILTAADGDGAERQAADDAGPDHTWPISPELAIAQKTAYNSNDRCDD